MGSGTALFLQQTRHFMRSDCIALHCALPQVQKVLLMHHKCNVNDGDDGSVVLPPTPCKVQLCPIDVLDRDQVVAQAKAAACSTAVPSEGTTKACRCCWTHKAKCSWYMHIPGSYTGQQCTACHHQASSSVLSSQSKIQCQAHHSFCSFAWATPTTATQQ